MVGKVIENLRDDRFVIAMEHPGRSDDTWVLRRSQFTEIQSLLDRDSDGSQVHLNQYHQRNVIDDQSEHLPPNGSNSNRAMQRDRFIFILSFLTRPVTLYARVV